jgi:glutamate dehydrogenase
MTDTADQVKDALLHAVVELAERRQQGHGGSALAGELISHYFARTAPQDLIDKDPIDLYAATIRHLQLAERRAPTEALVQIYNPNSDEDGWSSSHTVIDIVTQDMPFIVDSVLSLFERLGREVHVLVHPVFEVMRTDTGEIHAIQVPRPSSKNLESILHVEIDRVSDGSTLEPLEDQLFGVLADVRAAVEDWRAMRSRALEIANELETWTAEASAGSSRFTASVHEEPHEVAELLRWMEAGSFVFVGYREYDFFENDLHPRIVSRPETGLGTLRQTKVSDRDLGGLPPETSAQARKPNILNLTKANTISTVHRPVPLDYVGIKEIDADGKVTGERRILGLFTSSVYTGRVEDIPTVRVKVETVLERVDFHSTSHDYNRLLNTLQTFPRDELFQIDIDLLESMALDMLDLRDRRQVSLLVRRELYGRYLSCLIFVPRDRHSTDVRLQIEKILTEAYGGISVSFSTEISDAPLARIHMVIYTDPRLSHELPDTAAVQARLIQGTRTWGDYLRDSLIEAHGEEQGLERLARYGGAFDAAYRENVLAESAVHDIERLEVLDDDDLDVFLHRPLEAGRLDLRCKVYRSGKPIVLSDLVPLLHDLGAIVVDERPHVVELEGERPRFIYDIGLQMDIVLNRDDRSRVRDAVLAVWRGGSESDPLSKLVVTAGLGWRDVSVLRAYVRYFAQIGSRYSSTYVIDTLNAHPLIAAQLVTLFRARFDPAVVDREAGDLTMALNAAIESVDSLDSDRILRSVVTLIMATKRTNHWQRVKGEPRPALALKLDPRTIPGLPQPVPATEIFVYAPRTEGVHLRSGPVARGGLRWSERMEDYRTEVLGLMKAQTVKNSVIVPVGAKGGFVARDLPTNGSRDEVMAEVVACYRIFVGSLLDVTDNVVDDATMAPADVIRHDDDDPYLVVAADKGTATFSDTANEIARGRDFWLDDAFASGGSAGYDHKALAITARGAWVAVERHFRELGLDPATTPFTAVGVGDMSGDVFGNGLLRSDQTQLIAAFDHRDVFVDPDPDPAASFVERQRLYDMARSTWADYDIASISEGGGVFSRSAKTVPISTQMAEALGIQDDVRQLTPDELIQAVLRAPVDLVWNGGIGTYVKASSETDIEVGDRGNDSVRVDADELRCRVLTEGGNLGVSQLGRIEFAARGGRINTDAIDNSGGVDCSDHEVNLKILLAMAERNGDMTRKQRNVLLASMADEVCDQVLDNNYAQNRTLSAAVAEAPGMVQAHERLMSSLEATVGLNRVVEMLPSTLAMGARREQGRGLTRPELAVLLAYTKNGVTSDLLAGTFPDTPLFNELLLDYFPRAIRTHHHDLVRNHPLRRELIAMILSNEIVNRGGITMVRRLVEETSATASDISLAHLAAWRIFDLDQLWAELGSIDTHVDSAVVTALELEVTRLGERATRWLLRNEPQPLDVEAVVQRYQGPLEILRDLSLETEASESVHELVAVGVPAPLAARVTSLGQAYGFLDLATVSHRTGLQPQLVSALHQILEDRLGLSPLRDWVVALPREDHWQTMARGALRDQYFLERAELAAAVVSSVDPAAAPADQIEDWIKANMVAADRCRRTLAEIDAVSDRDLAHVSVALGALTQLRRTA